MSSFRTVNDIFYGVVESNSDRVMLHKRKGAWLPLSAREVYRNTVGTARWLAGCGVGKGDRVAILAENRPEWAIADFAAMLLGAASVPIYSTLTADQIAYILINSEASFLFVSTAEQLKKFLDIKDQTSVEQVVVMDELITTQALPMSRLMLAGPNARDSEFDALARSVETDDLATVIYTSGTTGTPKGVMLTHGNLCANVLTSLERFPTMVGELSVSFLPLSHITARHVDYALLHRGATLAYCPRIEELTQALAEVHPTIMVAVPRVYEKIRAKVESQVPAGFKRKIYEWALSIGREHRQETLAGKVPSESIWKLADKVLFSKVREALGGQCRTFISGGAPLGHELAEWFADIGIRIYEGYGLTETAPVVALNKPDAFKLGSVGKPLSNVEVKIAADGEILVRGPSVFKAYWEMPQETAAVFEDGWFKTGDIGFIDQDGFLTITDRKKDLIKTSGGKFIAPQPIEAKLKAHRLVAEAVVLGDRRKFPAAVIAPDFAALGAWAREHSISSGSRQELVAHPEVRALYEGVLVEINADLAQFEKIKRFLLVADEFTIANGMLTPTMKMRRRTVEQCYAHHLEAIYAEPKPEAQPVAKVG